MSSVFISVILPTYNSEKTLDACFKSIVDQSFKNFEIVVVDGASTDRTIGIVESFAAQFPNISLISEKDDGIYDAMNKGIRAARGNWLIFLGSDDELWDGEVFLNVFSGGLEADTLMIYGRALVLPEGFITPINQTFDMITKLNICHQTAFYSSEILKMHKYNTAYKALADWDLNLYLFGRFPSRIKSLDVMVCRYLNLGVSANWRSQREYRDHFRDRKRLYFKYLSFRSIIKAAWSHLK